MVDLFKVELRSGAGRKVVRFELAASEQEAIVRSRAWVLTLGLVAPAEIERLVVTTERL